MSSCYFRIWFGAALVATIAHFLTACSSAGNCVDDMSLGLPSDYEASVQNLLRQYDSGIASVRYGPEWATIDIIIRQRVDDAIVAWRSVSVEGEAPSFRIIVEPIYRTVDPIAIRDFESILELLRDSESTTEDVGWQSTNPLRAWHIALDGSAFLVLTAPWSSIDDAELARQVVLSRHLLREKDIGIAVVADWVDVPDTIDRKRIVDPIRLSRAVLVQIALAYFDRRAMTLRELDKNLLNATDFE